MNGVSRFISFVIGLIVLILLFVLIANRFNASRRTANAAGATPTVTPVVNGTLTPTPTKGGFDFFGLFRRNSPTPSPTPTLTFAQQMDSTMGNVNGTNTTGAPANPNQGQNLNNVRSIPNTGTPTIVIPLASAGLALGMWLRRRS